MENKGKLISIHRLIWSLPSSRYFCAASAVTIFFSARHYVVLFAWLSHYNNLCVSMDTRLLSILLNSKSMALQNITCISYVRLINCRLHIFLTSASSFSSQFLLLFLKSSRNCVLLLPTHFTSVIFTVLISS